MGLLTNIHDYLGRKECPYTQFAKYVACGSIAVAVDMVVFYLLAWLVFPCLKHGDPVVKIIEMLGFSIRTVSPELLIRNFWIIKMICFAAANATVYLLNVLYVFERGKHRRRHEVLLFFSIALAVFLGGTWMGAWLIDQLDWHITHTYAFILTLSVLANYGLRKFVVFKR